MTGNQEILLQQLLKFFDKTTYEDQDDIDAVLAAVDFVDPSGTGRTFFLCIGVAGAVKYTLKSGKTFTKTLGVGFYPVELIKVFKVGTTATSMTANYPRV